jgi:hypothetical protein
VALFLATLWWDEPDAGTSAAPATPIKGLGAGFPRGVGSSSLPWSAVVAGEEVSSGGCGLASLPDRPWRRGGFVACRSAPPLCLETGAVHGALVPSSLLVLAFEVVEARAG